MKKGISVDPITILREYITEKKVIKLTDTTLNFGSTKLPLNTKTGILMIFLNQYQAWNPKVSKKEYSLGDLWLFLDSKLNPAKYPGNKYYEDQGNYGLQMVSKSDQGNFLITHLEM